MDGLNETNITTGNDSMVTAQPTNLDLGVPGYLVSVFTLLLVITAWFLNIIVMRAINKADEEKLKVKFLLKNAVAGDLMLAFSLGMRVVLFQLVGQAELNASLANLCAKAVYGWYSYFAAFYQIFASMAVAIDRLYSILRPLSYHTMKYSVLVKTAIFIVLLGLTLGISLPMVTLKLQPGDNLIVLCYRAFEREPYSQEVLPFLIICFVFFTMGTYCSIFAIILYYRLKTRSSLGQQQGENQVARKRQTSLALTFFLIHITYVLMYLPGALYFSVVVGNIRSKPYLNYYLGQSTIIIYLANTIVDPIIYLVRIRSIKENVPAWWTCCAIKSSKKGKDEKSGVTATSSVINSLTG